MKILIRKIILFTLILAMNTNADTSTPSALCKQSVDIVKNLSTYSLSELNQMGENIHSIKTLAEYSIIEGVSYESTVSAIANARKISKPEAEIITLNLYKNIQLNRIKMAMNLNKITNENVWNKEYKKCEIIEYEQLKNKS